MCLFGDSEWVEPTTLVGNYAKTHQTHVVPVFFTAVDGSPNEPRSPASQEARCEETGRKRRKR